MPTTPAPTHWVPNPAPVWTARECDFMRATDPSLGECGFACDWTPPYGFVPEADCPVHDREEE
jgi:hypothetical protein